LSLIFRPQSLGICHGAAEEGTIQLEGKVMHREFLGHLVRYGIDVGGEMLMVDDPHLRGAQHYSNGSTIRVALKPDEIVALSQ